MAPFQSKKQRRFMYAHYPEIAKRWESKYGTPESLPERARRKQQKFKKHRAKVFYKA